MTSESAVLPRLDAAIRALAVGALGGLPAGLIAAGVGSRIAMRIVAITAGSADQGAITDAEATVGEITAGGTIFLLLLGSFAGVVGGVVYMGARRWVADGGRWKGLIFGLLLLTMFGSLIIEGGNVDFHKFGFATLNVAMFATLFVLFGLLVAPSVDRIERLLPPRPLEAGKPKSLAVVAFGLLLLLPAMASLGILAQGSAFILLPYVLLALPIASALIARTAGGFERLSDLRHRRGAFFGACAVLAVPVVAGLIMDGAAISEIYRAGG